ncbi:MAG TPA: pentapeptide repeat-containing protein, partial [Gemmataceae bacterium]|nr:pentapeptide repeat-containing protein [Gemmataceae bacterium]
MAKRTKPAAPAVPLKLQGKSVFLAGNFYYQAEMIQSLMELEGGRIAKELTDKTDIMVLGLSGIANPQKKAAKLNAQGAAIQVSMFDQFAQQIGPTPDEAVQLLLSGPEGIERWNRHCGAMNYVGGIGISIRQARKAGYTYGVSSSIAGFIRGADFCNADLTKANLGIPVEDCNFTGSNLKACELNLAHCQLQGANLEGVTSLNLVDCTAQKVDFSCIAADHVHIESSDLSGSHFADLTDLYVNFEKCQLEGADFSSLKAQGAFQFHQCNLRNANFTGANLDDA